MTEAEKRVIESASSWGEVSVLGALTGGHRNSAVLIELNGTRAVEKSTKRGEAAVRWLDPVQRLAEHAGFVVPRYLDSRTGMRVVEGVTVETWLEGDRFPDDELGRVLPPISRFHDLTRDLPQRPGFLSSLELLHRDCGGDVDLSAMPRQLVSACRSAWSTLTGAAVSVVHGDLNLDNLLLTPDGRIGLVDWDESRVDVSLLDEVALEIAAGESTERMGTAEARALLAWELATSWHLEPEYSRKLSDEFLKSIGANR